MNIEVYTDGSATTKDKPGGYAYVLVVDGVKHSESNGHMEGATNNDAEMEAAIQGLAAALKFINEKEKQFNMLIWTVTLCSDSQIVLGWANGTYGFKQESKLEKYKQLKFLVSRMLVKTRWVKGHSGDEHNERCDKLANEARTGLAKKEKKVKEPKKFRWNDSRTYFAYDSTRPVESGLERTDLSIINDPSMLKHSDILISICRVLSELVELKERS